VDYDIFYTLRGGPLDRAILCLAADLSCDVSPVRITIDGEIHCYAGDTIGESLDCISDAAHRGHAWRPVRWINWRGQTFIFSDDRPELPRVEDQR